MSRFNGWSFLREMHTESAAMYVRQRTEATAIPEDVFVSELTAQATRTRLPGIYTYTTAIIVGGGNRQWLAQVNSAVASSVVRCTHGRTRTFAPSNIASIDAAGIHL
jgi:hypothetical protein